MEDLRNRVVDIEDIENYNVAVTTATLINELTTESGVKPDINQHVAFMLLPWKQITLPTPKRRSKRLKLKNVNFTVDPGDIFSVRYEGITRGLVLSTSTKFLKNSVSLNVVLNEKKYINVKLSSFRVHMCGPRSDDQGLQTVTHVLSHLYNIQDIINYVRLCPGKSDALNWCLLNLKGDIIKRPVYTIVHYKYPKLHTSAKRYAGNNVTVLKTIDGVSEYVQISYSTLKCMERDVNNCKGYSENTETFEIFTVLSSSILTGNTDTYGFKPYDPADVPNDIDTRCVDYFTTNAPHVDPTWGRKSDYLYYDDWANEANWLARCTDVYQHKPIIGPFKRAMTNYNFGLGFSIIRSALAQEFEKHPEFTVEFDNLRNPNVIIELPYYSSDISICRKKKSSSVKLIVYKTGKVTLTGPNEAINKRVFVEFVKYIRLKRESIEQPQ